MESGGDNAVRALERFDSRSPAQFRLLETEIGACIGRVPKATLEDIRFSQAQIRRFAEIQRDALRDGWMRWVPGASASNSPPWRIWGVCANLSR